MENANNYQVEYPPYILRKSDFSLLKLGEDKKYYFKKIPGLLSNNAHTLESLRDVYAGSFSPVYTKEEAIDIDELRNKYYNLYQSITNKNDGHGGSYSEFSGSFLDFLKHKGAFYSPSEFKWSDDKVYSKNDIEQLKRSILSKKEIIIKKCSILDAELVSEMFSDFLRENK